MITKAQGKRYSPQPSYRRQLQLTAIEKGLLRWSMAERGDKVLDVQVGSGLLLEYLQRNMECVICGLSDDMGSVRESRNRLRNADIAYASREDIPWRENTFDSVLVKANALPMTLRALQEILRVLKPGGQLLLGFTAIPKPLLPFTWLLHPDTEEERSSSVTRQKTLDLLGENGLTQITWQRADLFHSIGIAWKPLEVE